MLTALIVQPGQHPQITQLCDDSTFLNLSVSRGTDFFCTASVSPLEDDLVIIHPWRGAALCLPENRWVNERIICGTFYITGSRNGALRSLTDDEISKYTFHFWEPEIFADEEVIDSWIGDL